MVSSEQQSLKGIQIRQPRAERSDALGFLVSFFRALTGHYFVPEVFVAWLNPFRVRRIASFPPGRRFVLPWAIVCKSLSGFFKAGHSSVSVEKYYAESI